MKSLRAFARASSGRTFSSFTPKDWIVVGITFGRLHLYLLSDLLKTYAAPVPQEREEVYQTRAEKSNTFLLPFLLPFVLFSVSFYYSFFGDLGWDLRGDHQKNNLFFLLILQAVKPGQILLNQVGDGQVVGTAGQAFSTFRAISGLLYQIHHPFRLLNISTESLDDALKSDSKLNFDFFRAGLAVVAASTELAVEFLLDGFNSLFIFLRQGVAFREDLPILTCPFQSLHSRNGNDVRR